VIVGRDRSRDEKGFREKMKLQIGVVKGKVQCQKRENEYRHYSFMNFGKQVKRTSD